MASTPPAAVVRLTNENNLQTTVKTNYVLQVRATDTGSPPRAGLSKITVNIVPTNAIASTSIQQEVWNNIGAGTAVSDLTSQARFPKRPDTLRPLTSFGSGQDQGDNYGSRIRAYLTPTASGSYTFYIASDDSSQLSFSSTTNPATATVIASVSGYTGYLEWTKFSTQKSAPVTLTAGQTYYLEALHKEGGGGDHVEVAWSGPGLAGTSIIDGSFLKPVDLNYAPIVSAVTLQVPITVTNGTVLTNFNALDSSLDLLNYKLTSGNLSNTFALDPETGALTVADNAAIATDLLSSYSLVAQVQDSGYGGVYPLRTAQASVTVQVVDNTAAVVWAGRGTNALWSTSSNWSGTVPSDNSKLRFAGTNQRTNFNDLLSRVGLVTLNNGGFNISGNPLLLLAGIIGVGDNTWAVNSALNKPQSFVSGSGTFVIAGAINNNGNLLTLNVVNGSMRLDGSVSGAGGLTKSGLGPLTITSANPYTDPTTVTAGRLILTNSGSIASSSTIDVQSGAILQVDAVTGGFAVPPGQTLKGNGTVLGPAIVYGGIAPGASIGSLTFSNALVLAGGTYLEISKSGSALTNDWLQVLDHLTCGGSLTVTNIGAPLTAGDTFQPFSASSFSGAFSRLNLPPLNTGLMWDSSQLTVNGTLRVTALVAPPILPVMLQGTNLLLQVQSSVSLNYVLEATPSLAPAAWTSLSTNVGTGGLLTIPTPLDPLQPRRFFRLRAY